MGLLDLFKGGRPGRRAAAPPRDTIAYPTLVQQSSLGGNRKVSYKPTPRNLRWFSLNPYARRAINAVKNPIAMLEWEIVPIDGQHPNSELQRQIDVASYCIDHPNIDDSARTLFEQVAEDILHGAGAVELQSSGDLLRPLWMWPVDGLSIQIYPGWSGAPNEARYLQTVGYGNFAGSGTAQSIQLRNDELMYIRPNPSTATPFGHGPLEIAFNTISKILGVGEFAGNVASNARPSIGLDLGEGAGPETLGAFRDYWRQDVEGQGNMPIFAMSGAEKARGPSVMRFYPEGDDGLYLKYQEFLIRELASAFDLSPQNLGLERDVNRNTSETSEDRDLRQAVKPIAHLMASHLTREALHAKLGFSQLEFRFKGIESEDNLNLAMIYETQYQNNAITPNEYREGRGMPPSDNEFADLLCCDVEIAMQAARGAAVVDDNNLSGGKKPKAAKKPKSKKG
jgi:Phage portal protein